MKAENNTESFLSNDTNSKEELLQSLRVAPIFAFLESYDRYFQLQKQTYKKGEFLFSPGENPYLYIIISGVCTVSRITSLGEVYEIGKATVGGILGEGVLFGQDQKDTQAIALTDSVTVAKLHLDDLNTAKGKLPKEMLGFYEHLLHLVNERQRISGRELLCLYDTSRNLSLMIQNPVEHIHNFYTYLLRTFHLSRIIVIEQHRSVRNMSILVYDSYQSTQKPEKISSLVEVETGFDFNPLEDGDPNSIRTNILRLESANGLNGFFLLFRNNEALPDENWRVLTHLAPQFAGVIDKIHLIQEERSLARKETMNYFPLA